MAAVLLLAAIAPDGRFATRSGHSDFPIAAVQRLNYGAPLRAPSDGWVSDKHEKPRWSFLQYFQVAQLQRSV
jgi:hypothetical protein